MNVTAIVPADESLPHDMTDEAFQAHVEGWKHDPIWDLFDDFPEGHPRHWQARAIQAEQTAKWRARTEENDRIAAVRLGIDVTTMRAVERMIGTALREERERSENP